MTKLIRISEVLGVELYRFFISNPPDIDAGKLDKLNKMLENASTIQLNLIYQVIEIILDITSL